MKNKKLFLLEINECDFNFIIKGAKKFKCSNILKFFSNKKKINTCTNDNSEGYNLDPWVQWVSVHTGKSSKEHKIFRIGEKLSKKIPQLWDILSKNGISSSIWGAFNSNLRNKRNINFFFPDPWSFTQRAHPESLNKLLMLPRYYAQTYPSPKIIKLFYFALFFFIKIIFSKTILYIFFNFFSFIKIFFKSGLKSYNLYFFLDLISLDYFINIYQKKRSDFLIFAMNSFAHYQHNYWDEKKNEWVYFWYLEEILKKVNLLEKSFNTLAYNGFDQKKIKNEYHLRPRNFEIFFNNLNLNYISIEPNMTAGATIFFDSNKSKYEAIDKLKKIGIYKYPLFEIDSTYKQKKIFVKLCMVMNKEIKNFEKINRKNYKYWIQKPKKIKKRSEFNTEKAFLNSLFKNIIYLKSTSRHKNTGLMYYSKFDLNKKNIKKNVLINHKLFYEVLNYFDAKI